MKPSGPSVQPNRASSAAQNAAKPDCRPITSTPARRSFAALQPFGGERHLAEHAVRHLGRREREHLDHVVVHHVEAQRVGVERFERPALGLRRHLPEVPEVRDRAVDRIAQQGEGAEGHAQPVDGGHREVRGDEPDLGPACFPALEEVLHRERARGRLAVTGPGIDGLGRELRAQPPQQGGAAGAIEVDEEEPLGFRHARTSGEYGLRSLRGLEFAPAEFTPATLVTRRALATRPRNWG